MSAGGGALRSATVCSLFIGESASLSQLYVNESGFAYSVNDCYARNASSIYFKCLNLN